MNKIKLFELICYIIASTPIIIGIIVSISHYKFMRKILIILISLFACIGCTDSPKLIEQIGKDVRSIQNEFEKGYNSDTGWVSIDTIIIDTTFIREIENNGYKYYRIECKSIPQNTELRIIWYYSLKSDSLSVKIK